MPDRPTLYLAAAMESGDRASGRIVSLDLIDWIIEALERDGEFQVINKTDWATFRRISDGHPSPYATPSQIYIHDMKQVRRADLMVAEVSTPSLGVGYEIGWRLRGGLLTMAAAQPGVNVSAMIRGNHQIPSYRYDSPERLAHLARKVWHNANDR